MAKKRLYVPVNESQLEAIKTMAKENDRSVARIAALLIADGFKFNMLEKYTLNPSADAVKQFYETH